MSIDDLDRCPPHEARPEGGSPGRPGAKNNMRPDREDADHADGQPEFNGFLYHTVRTTARTGAAAGRPARGPGRAAQHREP